MLEISSTGPAADEFFKYLPEDVKRMYLANNKMQTSQKRNFEIIQRIEHSSFYNSSQNWVNIEWTLKQLSASTL